MFPSRRGGKSLRGQMDPESNIARLTNHQSFELVYIVSNYKTSKTSTIIVVFAYIAHTGRVLQS